MAAIEPPDRLQMTVILRNAAPHRGGNEAAVRTRSV